MEPREIIEQARRSFDKALHSDAYQAVLADAAHLEDLLALVEVRPGKRYLDLGTGNGYIAFELASRFPSLSVTGLDIAANSIKVNQEIQQKKGLTNLDFVAYDGIGLPFPDGMFWGAISRYAFHHFPDAELTVRELHRVVEAQGFVIISDAVTHEGDNEGFIDRFQRLKPDGHVHYYRPQEMDALFRKHGFEREKHFMSTISAPLQLNDAHLRLLDETPAAMLEKYCIEVGENAVLVTLEVQNVLYRKA